MAPGGRLFGEHTFQPSKCYMNIVPKLTSKPKWKEMLDQVWVDIPYCKTYSLKRVSHMTDLTMINLQE